MYYNEIQRIRIVWYLLVYRKNVKMQRPYIVHQHWREIELDSTLFIIKAYTKGTRILKGFLKVLLKKS